MPSCRQCSNGPTPSWFLITARESARRLCCAAVIDSARQAGVKVLVDPIRSNDYGRYRGVHCMTPNRLEAQLATGMTITCPDDALLVGKKLVESLALEAVLVTLDRDGMALVREDGQAELVPTRARHVYDITGAGDMVLAVVGLCIADGADYDEAAALGNVAGGLEVEKFGVALLTRAEILSDLVDHDHARESKNLDRTELVAEVNRRRVAGQKVVFTNGCFDLLHPGHVRLLRLAADLGDYLVVGVNSDASARRLKGPSRPINPAEARAEVLSALEAVDCRDGFRRRHSARADHRDPPRRPCQRGRLPPRAGRRPRGGRSSRWPVGAYSRG